MLDEGEELISPDMYWENYQHIVETSLNAKIRTFPMFTEDTEQTFNVNGLQQAIEESVAKQGKAVILFNFPNNPTGYSITKDAMEKVKNTILSFAEKDIPILILCDDAYFSFFYEDDVFTESPFAVFSSLHKNILAVKIDGATKELLVWGLRVGFVTFGGKDLPEEVKQALELKIKGALRASNTSSSMLSEHVVLRTLQSPTLEAEHRAIFTNIQKRYKAIKQAIVEAEAEYPNSGLVPYPCNSGYFLSFRCTKASAQDIRRTMLENQSIALIALDNTLRFTFSAIDFEFISQTIKTLYREAQIIA